MNSLEVYLESLYRWLSSKSWRTPTIALGCTMLMYIAKRHRQRRFLPPGPKGIPILGNLLQIPQTFSWEKFAEWTQIYGPIYSLNLAGLPVVVIGSKKVATELLEHRANIYSSRPRFVLGGELMCSDKFLLFSPSGPYFNDARRAAQENLTPRAARTYRHIQESEACQLVHNIMKKPDGWLNEVKRTMFSVSLRSMYGWTHSVESASDPLVEKIDRSNLEVAVSIRLFTNLIDVFPVLLYLPKWLSKWRRIGAYWYKEHSDLFEGLLEDVRRNRAQRPDCFATGILQKVENKELTFSDAAWTTGTVLDGSTDTSIATLSTIILVLALYPDIQRRAQAELDTVVGKDRLPSFDDFDHLPYIQAFVKEIMRCWPVVPCSMPHTNTQDDWYDGYFIKKGSFIIPNIWGMHQDPELYAEPKAFRPERYLDESGKLLPAAPDTHGQGHLAFGFGKRICVGLHVANQAMFIDLVFLLWTFNIKNPHDLNGVPIPSTENAFMDTGLTYRPKPFKCLFEPRSSDVCSLVELECGRRL